MLDKLPGTRSQRIAAAVLVTIVTLILVDAVVLAMTPIGCGAAKALHIKPASTCNQVATSSIVQPTSSLSTPTGTVGPSPRTTASPSASLSSSAPSPISSIDTGNASNGGPFAGPASINPFGCGSSCPAASPGLSMTCRLPAATGGIGPNGTGGFVVFPSGIFQPDPRSAVTASGGAAQSFGLTYDRAYSKWLPVSWAWVSPDGVRYAYPGSDGIYVQNVRTGGQVQLGTGKVWSVIDVEAVGVYATNGSPGLWLLPFSGAAKQIATTGYYQAMTRTTAYGTDAPVGPGGLGATIFKLDIASGTTSEWFTEPGSLSAVIGFDAANNPVIQTTSDNFNSTWITISPNRGYLIANRDGAQFVPNGTPIPDSHGLWFGSLQGTALYTPDGNWYWMSGATYVAGACH